VFFFTHLRNRLHRRKQPKPVPSSIQFCESSCKRWTQRQRSRQWKLLSHDEDHRLRKRPLYNSWFSIWRIFATTSIWLKNKIKAGLCLDWERVRTSKITLSKVKKRTLKVQKEQQKSERRKSFFKLIRTSKMKSLIRTSKIRTSKITSQVKNDFQRSDFTYGVKKDQNVKNKKINYLWRITYVYQGLWGVRLGSIRLG
jgi:hypothetical protein